MVSIIVSILLVGLVFMVLSCEWTITAAGNELCSRALETCQTEIGYISDALYSQLTAIQLENVEILNNESVLALAMRSSILDKYETVSFENTIMKLIRSKLSQLNVDASAQLYIPTIHTIITTQKAAAATEREMEDMLKIIRAFPNGLYYTEESMGFWSASPLIHDPALAENSRLMFTSIQLNSLKSLLQKYALQPGGYQLLLTFRDHVLVSSHDTRWDEGTFSDLEEKVKTITLNGRPYYAIRAKHAFSDLFMIAVLRVDDVMSNMHRLQRMLRMLELACVLIVLAAAAALYRVVGRPFKDISAKMQQVGEGDLSVRMRPEKTAELDNVATTFNGMAERLEHLIDREYKSRLLAADAERKALQYQISPHFLYNTYFQLRNLILLEENEQAQRLADLMGRYLKYIVHQGGASATLGEEMDHARNYADIQSMRFGGRIEVRYDVKEGNWREMTVPRLLVQPLIENAFGHGLKNMEKDGVIKVTLRQTEGAIEITVEDNGESLTDAALEALRLSVQEEERQADRDGVALINIHRRLQLHFGRESGLFFDRSTLGGLQVTIRIADGKERM